MSKAKVFVLSTFPAPYRIGVFNELNKYVDLTVYFERVFDESRNPEWFEKNFNDIKGGLLLGADDPKKKLKTEIIKLILKNNFDLVLVYEYSTPTAALLMLICRIMGIPYFINVDGAFIKGNPIKNAVKKIFISGAEACLANGEHAKKYLLKFGAKEEQIFNHNFSSLYTKDIITNVINNETKKSLKRKYNLPENKTAISVGQFIYRKGFDILIKAWNEVNSEFNLLIIGGGEMENELKEQIDSFKLTNVNLIGFKHKEELFDYFKACDLFILPTREDIWGLVVNEAMACGLPVLTTDKCIAGLELIENYLNGFIVPVEDSKALAGRINQLLTNDRMIEEMGKRNLEKIRPYTIENVARSHAKVINNVTRRV